MPIQIDSIRGGPGSRLQCPMKRDTIFIIPCE